MQNKRSSYRLISKLVLLIGFLFTSFSQNSPAAKAWAFVQDPAKQDSAELVYVRVSVVDESLAPIKNLKQEHFNLFSEKLKQELHFFSDQDQPASILLLVDTSGSMDRADKTDSAKFKFLHEAFAGFIQLSHPGNEYAIAKFNRTHQVVVDWTQKSSEVLQSLSALAKEPAKGLTGLFDACYEALEMMKKSKHSKRVLILFSDGMDSESKWKSRGNALRALLQSGTTVYFVNVTSQAGTAALSLDEGDLERLVTHSGGLLFRPTTVGQLNAAFDTIAVLLRLQYVLGFKPVPAAETDKAHQLKIQLNLPPDLPRGLKKLKVCHQTMYYSLAKKN
jgi:VWFA-related protein